MLSSSPSLEITSAEDGTWTITLTTLFRTVVYKFQLGDEYEEHMPGGITIKVIFCRHLIFMYYIIFYFVEHHDERK